MTRRWVPRSPRLLTRQQAAVYCGLSLTAFATHCPVRPVSLGPDSRLLRFDIETLDRWIDNLGSNPSAEVDWLTRLTDDSGKN